MSNSNSGGGSDWTSERMASKLEELRGTLAPNTAEPGNTTTAQYEAAVHGTLIAVGLCFISCVVAVAAGSKWFIDSRVRTVYTLLRSTVIRMPLTLTALRCSSMIIC
jgi:hypothetical protein